MQLNVYSVRDVKGNCFARPFFMARHELALRAFDSIVNNPETDIAKWPADFSLFYLGTFDDVSGVFVSLTAPEFLATAVSFKKMEVPNASARNGEA